MLRIRNANIPSNVSLQWRFEGAQQESECLADSCTNCNVSDWSSPHRWTLLHILFAFASSALFCVEGHLGRFICGGHTRLEYRVDSVPGIRVETRLKVGFLRPQR